MGLRDDAPAIAKTYERLKGTLDTNCVLLDIYEGNLLEHLREQAKRELSPRAYRAAVDRIPPINLEKRMVDKLSTIYAQAPERKVTGTEADQLLWDSYVKNYDLDVQMQLANEYFNMHRGTALEPYRDYAGVPRLRSLPRDRFFAFSTDMTNPLRMTHFAKLMGKQTRMSGNAQVEVMVLYVYTDKEWLAIDENGNVCEDIMASYASQGIENTHDFGRIPFVYINRSRNVLNPKADEDLLAMTKLLPMMLTDVNYALKFQSFSIIYAIDCDLEKMELNPDVILDMKSDPTSKNKPEIGSIKPDLDAEVAIKSALDQLGLWLQSRNIRPGGSGEASAEQFQAALSKMVDEMDTTQERKKTIPFFSTAEIELFDLTKAMHAVWQRNKDFPIKGAFSKDCTESVTFAEQLIMKSRKETLDETVIELDNGILSKETAMKRVNPDMTEEELEEERARIEKEKAGEPDPEQNTATNPNGQADPEDGEEPPPAEEENYEE